jgi:GTP cyclohydrolase I
LEMKFEEKPIEDIQARKDYRNISIDRVGVCDLKIPLKIKGCEIDSERDQSVQASLSLSVNLSPDQKGIHMSRLLETALDFNAAFSLENMASFLIALGDRQGSEDSDVKIEFDYFFNRHAPVSGKISPQPYTCTYLGEMHPEGICLTQNVVVPVKTLCPCSKEISDYGAHNQRSKVFITILHEEKKENDPIDICLEEIIGIAERGASSPLYPLLKREDERHVTMSAYNKPCFVEDVVRNIASELHGNSSFDSYELRVLNYESIHSHNAFASIDKRFSNK